MRVHGRPSAQYPSLLSARKRCVFVAEPPLYEAEVHPQGHLGVEEADLLRDLAPLVEAVGSPLVSSRLVQRTEGGAKG